MQQFIAELVAATKGRDKSTVEDKVRYLLKQQARLGENWLGIARMALVVGSSTLACRCLEQMQLTQLAPRYQLQALSLEIEAGRPQSALDKLFRLIDGGVESPEYAHLAGVLLAQQGHAREAREFLASVVKPRPYSGESWLSLAHTLNFKSENEWAQALLAAEPKVLQKGSLIAKASFYSAKGKMLWDQGNYKEAYRSYTSCAELMNSQSNYNPGGNGRQINNILEGAKNFTLDHLRSGTQQETEIKPIFILGSPRAGTTLLEQLIAAHQDVSMSGESNAIGIAYQGILQGQPIGLDVRALKSALETDETRSVAKAYNDYCLERVPEGGWVTDKSLINNRYLPLIRKAFPAAPVIRISREWADLAWSNYRTFFSHDDMAWSWSIDGVVDYLAQEQRLQRYWTENFDFNVLDIRYEDLIANPKKVLRQVFRQCDLEYQDTDEHFYKEKSHITTASVGQVREPINNKSIESAHLVPEFMRELSKFADRSAQGL